MVGSIWKVLGKFVLLSLNSTVFRRPFLEYNGMFMIGVNGSYYRIRGWCDLFTKKDITSVIKSVIKKVERHTWSVPHPQEF